MATQSTRIDSEARWSINRKKGHLYIRTWEYNAEESALKKARISYANGRQRSSAGSDFDWVHLGRLDTNERVEKVQRFIATLSDIAKREIIAYCKDKWDVEIDF